MSNQPDPDMPTLPQIWLGALVLFSPIWVISYLYNRSHPEQLLIVLFLPTGITAGAYWAQWRKSRK